MHQYQISSQRRCHMYKAIILRTYDAKIYNYPSIMEKCSKHHKPVHAFCPALSMFLCSDCPEYYQEQVMLAGKEIRAQTEKVAGMLKQQLAQIVKKCDRDGLLKRYEESPWLKPNKKMAGLVRTITDQAIKISESLSLKIINGDLSSEGTTSLLLKLNFTNPDSQTIHAHAKYLMQSSEKSLNELRQLLEFDATNAQPLRGTEDFQELMNSRSALLVEIDSDKEEEYEPLAIPSSDVVKNAASQAILKIEQLLKKKREQKERGEVQKEKKMEEPTKEKEVQKQKIGSNQENTIKEESLVKDSEGARRLNKSKQQQRQDNQQIPCIKHTSEPPKQAEGSSTPTSQKSHSLAPDNLQTQPAKVQKEVSKDILPGSSLNYLKKSLEKHDTKLQSNSPKQLVSEQVQHTPVEHEPIELNFKPIKKPLIQNRQQQMQLLRKKQKQQAEKREREQKERKQKQQQERISNEAKRRQLEQKQAKRKMKQRSERIQQAKSNKTIVETVLMLMKDKKYIQAQQKLQQISSNFLQSPIVLRIQAKLQYYAGNIGESLSKYAKLIESDPNEPKHQLQKATIELESNNLAKCEKTLRIRKLEIPTFYLIKGDVNFKKGAEGEAQRFYEEANERRQTAIAHGRIATCLMKKGDWAKAIKSLDAAIRLDDKNSQFFNDRCYCYLKTKNYEEAFKSISMALALSPNSYVIFNNSALTQMYKLGGVPNARILDLIKMAYELNNQDLTIVLNYCGIFERLLGPLQTINLYEKFLKQKFGASPRYNLAVCRTFLKTNQKQYFDKAYLQLLNLYNADKYNNELRLMLCKSMALRGDVGKNYDAAKTLLVMMINDETIQGKEKADVRNTLARLHINAQNFKQAVIQLKQANLSHLSGAVYIYNLAYCQFKNETYLDALTCLQKLDNIATIEQSLLKKATSLRIAVHAKLNQKHEISKFIRILKQQNRFTDKAFVAKLDEFIRL